MKRTLPILLATGAVIIGGVLIVPSFMDWNKYKPQIIAQAKEKAGYDVRIDGNIGLALLPSPRLKLEGLTVAAPRGSTPNLLTMKQADVSVKLFPLLSGNIVVDTVRLVAPEISLETLADGSSSWLSDQLSSGGDAGRSGGAPEESEKTQDFSLGKMTIEDGSISYINRQSNASYQISEINTEVSAGSLRGPFRAEGDLTYGSQKIRLDVETEAMTRGKTDIPAKIEVALPEAGAKASFKGVVSPEPLELQGNLTVSADNLGAAVGQPSNAMLATNFSLSGLVTANDDKLQTQELEIRYGETSGKGSIAVSGLRAKNPVQVATDMVFAGVIDVDKFSQIEGKRPDESSVEEKVAKGEKLASRTTGYLPENVKLPFPIDATVRLSADAIKSRGVSYKGLSATVKKVGSAVDGAVKILDMPGKTAADATFTVRFGSSSKTGDTGIVYVDPSLSFKANGASQQLPTLLRAYMTGNENNNAFEIYKTARFDLEGAVSSDLVTISNSVIKLDQTTLGLSAGYKARGAGNRPDVVIDMSTDIVDFDHITARLNGQNRAAVQTENSKKASVETALAPVQSFNMPVNLTFDLSAQKAIYQQQAVTGLRVKGKASGASLTLDTASVQDYAGAAASLKGSVGDLQKLSSVDLSFYGKTGNVRSLMQTFKMDVSKLPAGVSAAEASIKAKGSADRLAFDADIVALNGRLSAAGQASGLLKNPQFSNLSIGASHPNLVKAIQIMNPTFTGGPGLEQPFEFETKAVKAGNVYDLSAMKASIGETSFTGDLKIDTGGAKPALTGAINAGVIALDSLLGAKDTARSGGGGQPRGQGADGKWSRETVETGWMHALNVDLGLSAGSIIYGGWNFVKPAAHITLKDGSLLVDNLNGGLFGGTAQLDAKVVDPVDARQPLSLTVQSKMDKVDVEPLATALSGSNRIKAAGDVSLGFNVQSSGLSPHALVSALQGKADLRGNNIVMRGFDLAQIGLAFVDTGKPLDRLNSLVGGATQGGETRFDTVTGDYVIDQGIVKITSMALDGPAANIASKGSVNLPQWSLDTTHTIMFKQAKDAGAFDVAIRGPLDSPANTFGRGLFNDVLTRRLQQKAVEKLPDVLGKDLTGKLQGLGILPPQQAAPQPAPAVQPPPATGDVNQQVAPDAQAAPPDAAPSQSPPAEQVDPAQKAIEGVLNGLLR